MDGRAGQQGLGSEETPALGWGSAVPVPSLIPGAPFHRGWESPRQVVLWCLTPAAAERQVGVRLTDT